LKLLISQSDQFRSFKLTELTEIRLIYCAVLVLQEAEVQVVFCGFVREAEIGNLPVARKLPVKLTGSFRQSATNRLNFLPVTATYYRVHIRAILVF
jgi:hypothetical protein